MNVGDFSKIASHIHKLTLPPPEPHSPSGPSGRVGLSGPERAELSKAPQPYISQPTLHSTYFFTIGFSFFPSRRYGSRTCSPTAGLNSRTQMLRKRTGLP